MTYSSTQDRIILCSVISQDQFYKNTPCWIWIKCVNYAGYGVYKTTFKSGPRKGKIKHCRAHRESLKAFKKVTLGKRYVCKHLCNNPSCVNPDHLERGTQKSNVKQTVKDGRHGNKYKRNLM